MYEKSNAPLYFYPRPPGGGRQKLFFGYSWVVLISIHALRVEGDNEAKYGESAIARFLSTPSGWRATCLRTTVAIYGAFLSTPSGWRATIGTGLLEQHSYISIHALRVEGDTITVLHSGQTAIFLSTPSGWRATTMLSSWFRAKREFLSTPSGWRATQHRGKSATRTTFLSTPSGWRATSAVKST